MKKRWVLPLILGSCLWLTACPAPNTSDNGTPTGETTGDTSNSDGNFSKQAYITLLNCLKEQQPTAAAAIDQAIVAAGQFPDSAFASADNPLFAVWAKQAAAAGCGG